MGSNPAISFSEVSFSYASAPVLESVSFEVPEGAVVAVAGPNGGGKTTLLRLALGLETPERGRIRILGEEPATGRLGVGYMPQILRIDPQFPMSALDVALMGRMRPGFPWTGRADREAARTALAQVGMDWAEKRRYASLSGGERQRVLIARALASHPRLLLFDEPTAMIDSAAQDSFAALLTRLKGSATLVVVTHDLGFVSALVDRVLFVNRRVRMEEVSGVSGHSFEELYGEKLHAFGHRHEGGES